MSSIVTASVALQNALPSAASVGLAGQLTRYQQLRREEKRLRARVDYLERQMALKGPLAVDVDLATLLQEERAKLATLRDALVEQEEHLDTIQAVPEAQRDAITAAQLEQVVSDLRAKREQLWILQGNIDFLREKQAKFGLDVPLNLANELKLAQQDLEKVQAAIAQLEEKLEKTYQLDPRAIADLDTMEASKLGELASHLVSKKEILERTEAQQRQQQREAAAAQERAAAAAPYEAMVLELLAALRKAAYPHPQAHVRSNGRGEWKLASSGNQFAGVGVSLECDGEGNPVRFRCLRRNELGHHVGESVAELSRPALMSALKGLWKPKQWWQFWRVSPPLWIDVPVDKLEE